MAKITKRDDELSGRPAIKKRLMELEGEVSEGFIQQNDRSDNQLDWWDIFDCRLGGNQYYNGNAKIFVPIVRNAVNARKTRFTNQIFPQSGRYVEAITENGDIPHATIALLEHYIRKSKLRTLVVPPACKNGDIEGQYNVYVSWHSSLRHTAWRETREVEVEGVEIEGTGEVETIKYETVFDEYPEVEVLSDADVLILPVTADSVDHALAIGGSVTVRRRWTKAKIKDMAAAGEIDDDVADRISRQMSQSNEDGRANLPKAHAAAAGIRAKDKLYVVLETWTQLKVDGQKRLCRVYFGGGNEKILGAKLNPYWCDRCPVISVPVEKVSGVAKGDSPVSSSAELQYFANDIVNEAADSATFSLLPIVMTDPLKNPKVGSMVLDLAAVWETSPNDTKIVSFPAIWKDGLGMVSTIKSEIFQSLGVNPAMIPQSTGKGNKRNQAEIAQEQAVDLLTTADAVTTLEEGVLTPIIERFAEYDAQFRNEDITIRAFGQMGLRAKMERVPPLQMGQRFAFRWFGVEAARNAAQIQQQIATMNVLRGIPQQLYQGRKLDLVPLIEQLCENVFGPRMAPLVFRDERSQLSLDPATENEMLLDGFDMPVSPYDNDAQHIAAHHQALREGDPSGAIRVHILKHQAQMAAKAAAQQQPPPGAPGTPGKPGVAGVPRPGGQVANPRQNKQPAGAIHPDQMAAAGAVGMPRKM